MRVSGKAPERVENQPELRDGLEFYLDAFYDLDTERNHGMGWMRIPWFSIVRYAEFYGLDEDQSDRLVLYIQSMDLAHITRLEANRKKD